MTKQTTSNLKLLLPTPLEQDLFRYAKESEPVLLHGKDSVGRLRNLIQPIHFILNCGGSIWGRDTDGLDYFDKEYKVCSDHDALNDFDRRNFFITRIASKLNLGIDSFRYDNGDIEYAGEEVFQGSDIFNDFLIPEIRKAMEDRNHKRIFELLRDTRCSSNKFTRVDCQLEDGKTVFGKLADCKFITQNKLIEDYTPIIDDASLFSLEPYAESYSNDTRYFYRPLLWNARTLFIDNLRCSKNDPNDDKYYDKLALKIEEGRRRGREHAQWLVAYAHTPNTFPPYFRNQFKLVSLDRKDHEVKRQEEKVSHKKGKLERGNKQHNVPPEELIPFIKQNIGYLQSEKGGLFKGGALAKRIQGDIYKRFEKKYGKKADYEVTTIRNMISDINTGKK